MWNRKVACALTVNKLIWVFLGGAKNKDMKINIRGRKDKNCPKRRVYPLVLYELLALFHFVKFPLEIQ